MPAFGESIVGDPALQREFFTAIQRLREPGATLAIQKSAFITAAMALPLNLSPDERELFEQHIQIKDHKITTHVDEGNKVLYVCLYAGVDTIRWVLERRGNDGNINASLQLSLGNRAHLASAIYTGPEGHLEINQKAIITSATQRLAPYRRGYADVARLISSMACLSAVPDILGALAKRD